MTEMKNNVNGDLSLDMVRFYPTRKDCQKSGDF